MEQDRENPTENLPVEAGALAEVLPLPSGAPREVYNPELAAAVCWEIADGKTLREACETVGVKWKNFRYWLLRFPDLERMWRTARRLQASELFDQALEQVQELIAQKGSMSQAEVRGTDVAIGALRGMAEVLAPAEFSNRQPITPSVLVRIETTLNLNPQTGTPPTDDRGDVYTVAAKTMGTVIEQEPFDGQTTTMRERNQKAARARRTGRPGGDVYTMEVADETGV